MKEYNKENERGGREIAKGGGRRERERERGGLVNAILINWHISAG